MKKQSRKAWYLIGGDLFSPDGNTSIIVKSEKLKDLPDMMINEDTFPFDIDSYTSIEINNEGKLIAKKNGKNIVVSNTLNINPRVGEQVRNLYHSTRGAYTSKIGKDCTQLYRHILSSRPPALSLLQKSVNVVQHVHNNVIMIGIPSYINFMEAPRGFNNTPLYLGTIDSYVNKDDIADSYIYQDDEGSESEILMVIRDIKRRKQTRKEVPDKSVPLQTIETLRKEMVVHGAVRKSPGSPTKVYSLYSKISDNPGELIATYRGEVYNELKKNAELIAGKSIMVTSDGTHTIDASLTRAAKTMKISEGVDIKEAIKVPGTTFDYSVESSGRLEIYARKDLKQLIVKTVNEELPNCTGLTAYKPISR